MYHLKKYPPGRDIFDQEMTPCLESVMKFRAKSTACPRVYLFAAIFSLTSFVPTARAQSVPAFSAQSPTNPNTEQHFMVDRGDVHIEVIAQGHGPVIVILPSLGRGAEDYGVVADLLAREGFRVLRPQPRGVGKSIGPMANLTLHDFAADIAAVIEHEGKGPAVVVGHAYGHFVTRMLATDRPDLVRGAVLAAASAGKVPAGRSRAICFARSPRSH